MEAIEEIILRHPQRGMDKLAYYMRPGFCREAAEKIYALERGTVLLLTGFYVHGSAETDGPAGTWAVAGALKALSFSPVIVTDSFLNGVFEAYGFPVEYYPIDGTDDYADTLLEKYRPVLLFSLERCGRSIRNDYVNMRGVSIRPFTAPVDALFLRGYGKVPTIGVGDGGNEVGMGNVYDIVRKELSCTPATVKADTLIIATVSNWGGYGLCACLSRLCGKDLVPAFEEQQAFMASAREKANCIDGVNRTHNLTEDGYPLARTMEILTALKQEISR